MTDIRELDRRAVEVSRALVRTVGPEQHLTLPTPCAEWDLRALLAHMTAQHHGFARAVAGERTDVADWHPVPADDVVAAYDEAADHVLAAFRAPADTAYLPEIRGGVTVPAAMAMGFHFVDYVVHSWDVAAALGRTGELDGELDDDVLAAALAVARQVPTDDASRGPGLSFGPVLPTAPGAGTLDQVLTLLGRSPAWPR
jgi:uncharacterized protein (TIGR03086 family)